MPVGHRHYVSVVCLQLQYVSWAVNHARHFCLSLFSCFLKKQLQRLSGESATAIVFWHILLKHLRGWNALSIKSSNSVPTLISGSSLPDHYQEKYKWLSQESTWQSVTGISISVFCGSSGELNLSTLHGGIYCICSAKALLIHVDIFKEKLN